MIDRFVFLPRPALAPFVMNVLAGTLDGGENVLPAMTRAQLIVYAHGGCRIKTGDGRMIPMPQAFIAGPCLAPRRFIAEPGSRFAAVALRPGRFGCLFDEPLDELRNEIVGLDCFLRAPRYRELLDAVCAAGDAAAMADAMQDFLIRHCRERDAVPAAPLLAHASASQLPASDLAALAGISLRQFERRFLKSYGMPLRDYRRLLRFGNSMALLMLGTFSKGEFARVASNSGYFDQAHFVRDFRDFIGETPGNFVKRFAADHSEYRLWQLNASELESFREHR